LKTKQGLTREQAVLSLLYDDFMSDLVKKGKNAVADFWSENRSSILDLLKSAAFSIIPRLLTIGGNNLKS
jgi:hypothetical protein